MSDDAAVEQSLDWIVNYENAEHVPVYIYDGITRKERTIIVPTMEELLVQHCIVNAMKPMFCKGMYEHSYASLPGRGAHKGKQVIEKWIRTDPKNCKYVLKMDIRHFFDTIPHDRLKAKLKKTVHDEKMLDLLFRIIDVTEVGIPLGFYTSQWLSNWYLQGLDHFIKEQLCAVHYMRYMDDMVVFGSNKRVLHRMRQAISDYLEMELGLELKANRQVFRFSYGNNQGRDLDFMGFRFYRNRTILRKSIMYKATRKARKISKKEKATILDARQMLSYLGWIDCTDTYLMYRKWIKPCVSFQQLKRKVSRYDKYDEKRVYQKLVSLYTAKGGKTHGVKLKKCRDFFSFFLAHKIVSVECVKHRHAKFGGGFVFCHVILLIILKPSCSNAIPIEYILCNVPDIHIVPFGFSTLLHNLIHFLLNLCFSSTLFPPSESLSHEPLFTETIFPP